MEKILESILKIISQVFSKKNNSHAPIPKKEVPNQIPIPAEEKLQPVPQAEKVENVQNNELNVDISIEKLNFIKGIPNHAKNSDVIKLREIIKDALTGGSHGWDLQCTEYVQYKIREKLGIEIKWPPDRPRDGGKWAVIFEKNKLYKVINEPKKYCAASFANPLFNPPWGHVAFVEEVLNDGSIRISEANWPPTKKTPEGEYNERIIPKIKWQNNYGCRFIDFS